MSINNEPLRVEYVFFFFFFGHRNANADLLKGRDRMLTRRPEFWSPEINQEESRWCPPAPEPLPQLPPSGSLNSHFSESPWRLITADCEAEFRWRSHIATISTTVIIFKQSSSAWIITPLKKRDSQHFCPPVDFLFRMTQHLITLRIGSTVAKIFPHENVPSFTTL